MPETLDVLIKTMAKQFGDNAIVVPGRDPQLLASTVKHWIPLTLKTLNRVIGHPDKGLPCGKIIEVYGPEGHGKSTLALKLMEATQRVGGNAALVDSEHAFNREWAKINGVDINKLAVMTVGMGGLQEVLEKIEVYVVTARSADKKAPITVVWDSVAGTPTAEELSGDWETTLIGIQARALSRGLRRLMQSLANNEATLICINQVRDKVGFVGFGAEKETTPGGRALKFAASVRLKVVRTRYIKRGDVKVGIQCKAINVKNKCSLPFKDGEFVILSDGGLKGL